jgi:c-di-GMP-binding flagellar brake protein YcgR
MALLEMLGLKKKNGASLRTMLPALHSFIDVAVKNGPKGSICFESAGAHAFHTSALPGMAPGQNVLFAYSNSSGRYRFNAAITAVDGKQATFAMPSRIETVAKFSGSKQRTMLRIDTATPCQWRYAPMGKIPTEWHKGVLSDISRTGASLATDRDLKIDVLLELSIPLKTVGDNVVLRAEVKRVDKIESSKKHNVGVRFVGNTPENDRAIMEFINRRQTDLRNRGLA